MGAYNYILSSGGSKLAAGGSAKGLAYALYRLLTDGGLAMGMGLAVCRAFFSERSFSSRFPHRSLSCELSPCRVVSCGLFTDRSLSCELSPRRVVSCGLFTDRSPFCGPFTDRLLPSRLFTDGAFWSQLLSDRFILFRLAERSIPFRTGHCAVRSPLAESASASAKTIDGSGLTPARQIERCEVMRSYGTDSTGEAAVVCGASADFFCEECGWVCELCARSCRGRSHELTEIGAILRAITDFDEPSRDDGEVAILDTAVIGGQR
jgi:hypothetical protein